MRVAGAQSGFGRDHRLHHYVRGRLLSARGRRGEAIEVLGAAISSRNLGYTRTNYELARVLLATGRPREAITILQPALRGPFEASNMYVTRTEIHELLAQAWDSLGSGWPQLDSARVHYAAVVQAWRRPDRVFARRAAVARRRLRDLTSSASPRG